MKSDRMKSDMKSSIDQIKAQTKDDFSNDQAQLKNENNQLINRSEIQPIKDDLNQFKENSNERFSKSQDELNQFKVNSNENLSKSQEENEKLKKQIGQLKVTDMLYENN
ncbi:hypothetical protein M9Y10_018526 [Tritrichomonas musculus]|uniref:Uncharacterized protein n=1 Tax=Tritrichomonas musculus TaxID=1915356 RepID=A0ABR2HMM8_9EUKA